MGTIPNRWTKGTCMSVLTCLVQWEAYNHVGRWLHVSEVRGRSCKWEPCANCRLLYKQKSALRALPVIHSRSLTITSRGPYLTTAKAPSSFPWPMGPTAQRWGFLRFLKRLYDTRTWRLAMAHTLPTDQPGFDCTTPPALPGLHTGAITRALVFSNSIWKLAVCL